MQHFLVLSDAWGALYRVYIFLREGHPFLLYVLNGRATLWHKVNKLYKEYSFLMEGCHFLCLLGFFSWIKIVFLFWPYHA